MSIDDRAAFMRTICENPHDDTPRLIFADWLEEQGDLESLARAEFIRAQIEISRLPSFHYDSGYAVCERCGHDIINDSFVRECTGKGCSLFRRASDSSWNYRDKWSGSIRRASHRHEFRRGFVAIIPANLNEWLSGEKNIVLEHPIERVVITDKKPLQCNWVPDNQDITYRFFEDNLPPRIGTGMIASVYVPANRLPSFLFAWNPKLRSHFISESDAMEELSKTCISIATPSRQDAANPSGKPNLFFRPKISALLRPPEKR